MSDPRRGSVCDVTLETIVGLSWYFLAWARVPIANAWRLAPWAEGATPWALVSTARLVLGLAAYPAMGILLLRTPETSPITTLRALLVRDQPSSHFGTAWRTRLAEIQPPVVEEFLARGPVVTLLLRSFAILWSTLLFGLWHLPQGPRAALSIGMVGLLIFAGPRAATGTIWAGVFMHLHTNANLGTGTIGGCTALDTVFLGQTLWRRRATEPGRCS